jgi:hypothetical protein
MHIYPLVAALRIDTDEILRIIADRQSKDSFCL